MEINLESNITDLNVMIHSKVESLTIISYNKLSFRYIPMTLKGILCLIMVYVKKLFLKKKRERFSFIIFFISFSSNNLSN